MPSRNLFSNPLFSEGANRVTAALDPSRREQGNLAFPFCQGWDESLRVGDSETLQRWFRRIIGGVENADSRIGQCAVNDDLAFFGRVRWNSEGIDFCTLQALVTMGGSLVDFYLDESGSNPRAAYYRLDLDLSAPGPLFKEALPHVHCVPDGSPRFAFVCSDEYLPITFLEFIYLNHFHDDWLTWARSEVSRRDDELPLERIVESFNSGSISGQLAGLRPYLTTLKRFLLSAKRGRIANPPRPHAYVSDLNYHSQEA